MIGESGVQFAEWKNAFYSKHSGESDNTKKQAFSRARQDLKNIGAIDCLNDVYSLRVGCGHFEVLATVKWACQQRQNKTGTEVQDGYIVGTCTDCKSG